MTVFNNRRAETYLKELFEATKYLHTSRCFRDNNYYQQSKRSEKTPSVVPEPPKYWMFATIARQMKYSINTEQQGHDLVLSKDDGFVRYSSKFEFDTRRKEILQQIDDIGEIRNNFMKARCEGDEPVHLVICLGEFDYPCFLQATRKQMGEQDPFIKELQEKATHHNCLISAGTYHQIVAGRPRNTALLFEPDGKEPVRHIKWRPAQKLGERILHPKNNEVRFYLTKFGVVGLLVCADCYDMNIVTSIARRSKDDLYLDPDFLIVPSYNPPNDRRDSEPNRFALNACERIAYLTGLPVAYVNSANFEETTTSGPPHLVICPGEEWDKLPSSIVPKNGIQAQEVRIPQTIGDEKISIVALDFEYMEAQKRGARAALSGVVKEAMVGELSLGPGFE